MKTALFIVSFALLTACGAQRQRHLVDWTDVRASQRNSDGGITYVWTPMRTSEERGGWLVDDVIGNSRPHTKSR